MTIAENIDPELPVYILDSYAVLAYVNGEPAGKRVEEIFAQSASAKCRVLLSMINLGEVVYLIERRKGLTHAQETLVLLNHEPIELIEADRTTILMAAHIKAHYPLSYADAFVVGAAQAFSGTVLTGDAEFHAVEDLVQVEWLA